MAWRIHFTAEDLARTRVAATLGPLAETMFGLGVLSCPRRRPAAALTGWRRRARGCLTPAMRPLTNLAKVDLWTLTGEAPTIERGVRALLEMSSEAVHTELEFLDREGRLPESAWTVLDRDSTARRQLANAANTSYQTLVEPHWSRVRAHLQAERTSRGRVLLDGGVERLLATLHPPRIRWRLPVLELLIPSQGDIHLDGRGLTLVPSLFVGDLPVLLRDLNDETAAPRLVYPAVPDPAVGAQLWTGAPAGGRALGALVGRTRAAALGRIGDGCTTSELARVIGVSPSSASQHATVLRDAGLITTRRQGGAVLHALTALGVELLGREQPHRDREQPH